MSDEDYLNEQRKALEDSVEFFAPTRKIDREKWIVAETLANLGVHFSDFELQPVSDEPPDIRFRGAEYELKEIMDPGRPRHLEYKKALQKANDVKDPAELSEPFRPRDTTLTEIYEKVLATTSELLSKYAPSTCRNLDLLFYVNLQNVTGLIETPSSNVAALCLQPWRSVSFLMDHRTCVLVARNDAPAFIRDAVSKVIHRQITSA